MIASTDKLDPARQDGREVEWQLECADLGPVRRWLNDHGTIDGLVLEPRSTRQIFDTYLDTDDWRIHRAGFALRIRRDSGRSEATLKSLHSASTEVADRQELNEALQSPDSGSIRHAPGPVGSRVQAVSGARALMPLFEVRTRRQRYAVRRKDEAAQLGEISLDETVISPPQGEPRRSLQRVEVEALTESREPLQSLVKTLRDDCALEAASDSKYSQGLQSVGLAPGAAPQFAPTAVDRCMTLAEVALANLRRYLSAWCRHEPGARLGDDPEELHGLRVAGRRMDAVLREFADALPAPLSALRPVLKELLRVLGGARDLDVALLELESFSRGLPEAERSAALPLMQHLTAERSRARGRMLTLLDSARVQEGLRELTACVAGPASPAQPGSEMALTAAPDMIRRRYRKMSRRARRLRPDSAVEAYHDVRGRVKKLRYALEAVGVVFGKPADELLRALRRWQEKLGQQQDAAVASRRLKELAVAPPADLPPATLFLMGQLAEHHAGVAARARKRSAKGYRRVREKWAKLGKKLGAPSASGAPRATRAPLPAA